MSRTKSRKGVNPMSKRTTCALSIASRRHIGSETPLVFPLGVSIVLALSTAGEPNRVLIHTRASRARPYVTVFITRTRKRRRVVASPRVEKCPSLPLAYAHATKSQC